MKVNSTNALFSEYNPKLKNYGQILLEQGEVDRSIFGLLPAYSSAFAAKARVFKAYNPDIKTVSQSEALIASESHTLVRKLLNFDMVNVVELAMDSTCKSLPFILELFEHSKIGSYKIVSNLSIANQQVMMNEVREAVFLSGLDLEIGHIFKNMLYENILEEAKAIKTKHPEKNVCNLFLLLGSQIGRLGHGLEDNNLVANISKSMTENDYLVVLNQVFDTNNMDEVLNDMQYLVKNRMYKNTEIIAEIFNPSLELSVKHSFGHTGLGYINMYTVSRSPIKIFGLDIEENREITVLRYNCLSDSDLKRMFSRQNLRLLQCSYSPKEDHGIYFLERR